MARKKEQAPAKRGRTYRLTVTEKQLAVIQTALEWFFRLQMGQFFDYVTEIARNGFVYDKSNPNNSEEFERYIRRRNDSQPIFEMAFRVAQPKLGSKTEDMMIAEDTWRAIRHYRWKQRPEPKDHWTVDADDPLFLTADGHVAKIEEVTECG